MIRDWEIGRNRIPSPGQDRRAVGNWERGTRGRREPKRSWGQDPGVWPGLPLDL